MNKYLIVGLVGILGFNATAYAGWPVFHVVTPEQLQSLETSSDCPSGEVRIPIGTQVPIQNRYIPSNEHWFWDYQGDGQCFSQTKNLQYLSIEQNGAEYPSIITTHYGFGGVPTFQFVFQIPEHPWDCGYFVGPNPPISIGCAQDEK